MVVVPPWLLGSTGPAGGYAVLWSLEAVRWRLPDYLRVSLWEDHARLFIWGQNGRAETRQQVLEVQEEVRLAVLVRAMYYT